CKRLLRRGNCEIDFARIAVGDLRIGLSCSRLDVVEIFAADRVNELAVDEVLNFLSRLCHVERSRDILYASYRFLDFARNDKARVDGDKPAGSKRDRSRSGRGLSFAVIAIAATARSTSRASPF